MSVSTAYSILDTAGNGSTTAFPVTWPFLDGTLVVSEIVNATGVTTVKTINSDYTVTGGTDDDGLPQTGTVTMAVAPASGRTLRIQRSTPLTQATAWAAFDAFPQKTAEGSFDKALLIQQELGAATALGLVDTPFATYWDAMGEIIRNVGEPEEDDDAATKAYVDERTGDIGATSISIGTVTTGAAGSSASASLTGTYPTYTLNFTIPRGDAGAGNGDLEAANNLSDVASAATSRTNLGVGTGDSPQFTAVNIGHATDTTLTRTGAGVIAVEGNTVWTAGNNATSANFLANTASVGALTPNAVWSAAAPVTLTDSATIAVDMNTFVNAIVTLGGNRTLGTPSNAKPGQSGLILIKQDGSGSRTLAYAAQWYFPADTAPTLSTTASYVDKLFYFVETSSIIHAELVQDSR
jgi:hypothetical protein